MRLQTRVQLHAHIYTPSTYVHHPQEVVQGMENPHWHILHVYPAEKYQWKLKAIGIPCLKTS